MHFDATEVDEANNNVVALKMLLTEGIKAHKILIGTEQNQNVGNKAELMSDGDITVSDKVEIVNQVKIIMHKDTTLHGELLMRSSELGGNQSQIDGDLNNRIWLVDRIDLSKRDRKY